MKTEIELLKTALSLVNGVYPYANEWRENVEKFIKEQTVTGKELENELKVDESSIEVYCVRTYGKYNLTKDNTLYDWTNQKKHRENNRSIRLKKGDEVRLMKTEYDTGDTYYTIYRHMLNGILYSMTYLHKKNGKWRRDANSDEFHIMILKNRMDYDIPKEMINKWY